MKIRVSSQQIDLGADGRQSSNHPAETTGKWIAASFEHDSARQVSGYAAPQLHTHVVSFNLTETKSSMQRRSTDQS
jgi:hypothetical protein